MKRIVLLIVFCMVLVLVASAMAQGIGPSATEVATDSCDHQTLPVDPDSYGPLAQNDQLISAFLTHCPETNEMVLSVISRWAGNNGHTARLNGIYTVETDQGQAIHASSFEGFNVPDESGALMVPVRWVLPLDGEQYRIDVSALLCDVTAGACQSEQEFAWFIQASTASITVHKSGRPLLNTQFHLKSADGDVIETHLVSADELHNVGGEEYAQFTFTDLVVPRGQSSRLFVVEEDMSGQPYGVQVVSPANGRHEIVVTASDQDHLVSFVNRDNRVWLPIIQKPYPPGTCLRRVNLQYVWQGVLQNNTYTFQPVSADIEDLGVLVYGTLVHLSMTDDLPLDEITLVKHFPDGGWDYVYTNWVGPDESIYGAHEDIDDPAHQGAHRLSAGRLWGLELNYLNADGVRCTFSLQVVWDPPENSTVVAIQVDSDWKFYPIVLDEPNMLEVPTQVDRVLIFSSDEGGWIEASIEQLRAENILRP